MPELYLGRWNWATEGGQSFWRMPRADIGLGLLDLRSLPQCGSPGPTPQGFGLFALSARDDTIGYYLGDNWGSLVGAPRKLALKTALALGENIAADTPLGILLELLSRHADPTGALRWKPLRGSLRQGTRFSLMGTEVWAQALDPMVRANTIAVFQADYRRNKANGTPLGALQRWTGATMRSLWGQMLDELAAQLLPPEYVVDGWGVPDTTWTESFTKADNGLGPDLTWTALTGTWGVTSNTGRARANAFNQYARADSDLASDDHYSQAAILSPNTVAWHIGGAICRKDSTTTLTFYDFEGRFSGDRRHLFKVVNGTITSLAGPTWPETFNANTVYTLKVQADDSTIKGFKDGVEKDSVADTSITGNLRCGLNADMTEAGSYVQFDSFEAGDLAAALNLERIERHYPRGVARGVLRGVA